MKKFILPFLVLTITFTSCSSSKKNHSTTTNYSSSVPKSSDDGLSFETAIVITEKTETKGVDAEYKWIRENYTGYIVKKQSLNNYKHKNYDIITIIFPDNTELKLFFDISNFFGKF